MAIKPYNTTCPKCGSNDILRKYLNVNDVCPVFGITIGTHYNGRQNDYVKEEQGYGPLIIAIKECITNYCRVCGYRFEVDVLSSEMKSDVVRETESDVVLENVCISAATTFEDSTWKGVTWKDDTWWNGTWKNGVWKGGIWLNGIWKDGTWKDGTWKNGTWQGGIWENGTWEQGWWKNGVWQYGTWKDGSWKDGTWKSGTWKGGLWHNGTWKTGTWYSGLWKNGTWENGIWKVGIWKKGIWKIGLIYDPDKKGNFKPDWEWNNHYVKSPINPKEYFND